MFLGVLQIGRGFFLKAEDGIRDLTVTGVQTCALPIWRAGRGWPRAGRRGARAPWTRTAARRHRELPETRRADPSHGSWDRGRTSREDRLLKDRTVLGSSPPRSKEAAAWPADQKNRTVLGSRSGKGTGDRK